MTGRPVSKQRRELVYDAYRIPTRREDMNIDEKVRFLEAACTGMRKENDELQARLASFE